MIDRRQKTPTVASLNLNFAKKSGYAFDSSERRQPSLGKEEGKLAS